MSFIARSTTATLSVLLIAGAPAESRQSEVLGNLTCSFGEAVETETDASRAQKILCVFDSLATGTEELYEGTAYFATGTAASGSKSWIVKGPPDMMQDAGGLEQSYAIRGMADGSTAEPALIGKDTDDIALHPVTAPEAQDPARSAAQASAVDLKLRTTAA